MKWCAAESEPLQTPTPILRRSRICGASAIARSRAYTRYCASHCVRETGLALLPTLREQLPTHGVEAGLLIVAERIVEVVKRRLHRLDAAQHGRQALADRCEPRRRR